jgi:hypothetical protein
VNDVDRLEPLFDLHSNMVGWILPGRHVFDRQMNWVAYLSEGHAWSVATGNWIGEVPGLVCLDREGRVVASAPGQSPDAGASPRRPPRKARVPRPPEPSRPPNPPRPPMGPTPPGGWSRLRFSDWAGQ